MSLDLLDVRAYFDPAPLKPVLESEGISSYRLSKLLGCSESLLSRMWRGERSISLEMAQAACQVLGVDFTDVFGPQLAQIGLMPIDVGVTHGS